MIATTIINSTRLKPLWRKRSFMWSFSSGARDRMPAASRNGIEAVRDA
jgi:hypothetical protein